MQYLLHGHIHVCSQLSLCVLQDFSSNWFLALGLGTDLHEYIWFMKIQQAVHSSAQCPYYYLIESLFMDEGKKFSDKKKTSRASCWHGG